MASMRDYRPAAYVIVVLGFTLALAAALVPFYGAAYHLKFAVLLALLTPFALYAMFVEFLRGPWLLASGLALFGVCLAVTVFERYLHYDGYADGVVYWAPLVASAIVLPSDYMLGRR
jgi:hypothetical protein